MAKPVPRLSLTLFGMRGMLVVVAGMGAVFAAWRYFQENIDPDRSILVQRRRQISDTDARVRLQAAQSLGDMRQDLARPAARSLVPALFDPDALVREAAADSLDHLFRPWLMTADLAVDAPEVSEALVRRLDDPAPTVRAAALRALATVVEGMNFRAWTSRDDSDEEAVPRDFDPSRAVPAVIPLLRDPDPAVREAAAWALTQVHPDPAEARRRLLDAFRDEREPRVRSRIFYSLNSTRITSTDDPAMARWLVALLDDPDPDIRQLVPSQLEKVVSFPDDTRTTLIGRLQEASTNPQLADFERFRSALSLNRLAGNPEAIRPFLQNPDPWIRLMSRRALGLPEEDDPR
ncbi:MAG: HEAT repeat domain-containing protein [Isosphaeraceae bacterium]